jgi:hypothetical protein
MEGLFHYENIERLELKLYFFDKKIPHHQNFETVISSRSIHHIIR